MEERKFLYRVEVASKFSLRFFFPRKKQIEEICNKLGEEGWELCGFSINHFTLRYYLIFKKER